MTRGPKHIAASVRARLLNLAHERGEQFQRTLIRYATEGLLRRLEASAHRDAFVLKGASLYLVWHCRATRHTRDIDLLGFGDGTPGSLARRLADVISTPVADDGLRFDPASIRTSEIRVEDEYGGTRLRLDAYLGAARIDMQIDVGLGDAVFPAPERVPFPTLLGLEAPTVRAYARETAVAEKAHAMVVLGTENSRLKDYYDLRVWCGEFAFDGERQVGAVRATFERRTTPLPDGAVPCLTSAFYEDDARNAAWTAFLRRQGLSGSAGAFAEAGSVIRAFLAPVLDAAAGRGETLRRWEAGGPWR